MKVNKWIIYGAYGYSGRLILKQALKRGLRPIIAGRRKSPLKELAARHELEYRSFDLDKPQDVREGLKDCYLVVNAAGPFSYTFKPMLEACCHHQVHYTDITGEISVIEAILSDSQRIASSNIIAVPGIGFDVIPSDCLADILAKKMPAAVSLKLGFKVKQGQISRGTLITMLEHINHGNWIRSNAKLISEPIGKRSCKINFEGSPEPAIAIPWGDVASAYYSTQIKNIEVYLAASRIQQLTNKIAGKILKISLLKRLAQKAAARFVSGSSDSQREGSKIILWGQVQDRDKNKVEARLITPDGYDVTALGSVCVVERLLLQQETRRGAFTPSQLFDSRWLLKEVNATLLDDQA